MTIGKERDTKAKKKKVPSEKKNKKKTVQSYNLEGK